MNDEQLFKRKRSLLYSICVLIFLLHADLSILLNKVFAHGFSKEQMDSLTSIFLVALIIAIIRYHQAVVTSKSWTKMVSEFLPFKRTSLYNSRILLDRMSEGESEHDDQYWMWAENDPTYISPNYILEEDDMGGWSQIKKIGSKHDITKIEEYWVKLRIKWLVIRAWCKFSINHPAVLDVFIPYLFFVLTFLEITGLLSISALLGNFGHLLRCWNTTTEDSCPNMYDLGAFFL